MKVTDAERSAWESAAGGLPLATWMKKILNASVGYVLVVPEPGPICLDCVPELDHSILEEYVPEASKAIVEAAFEQTDLSNDVPEDEPPAFEEPLEPIEEAFDELVYDGTVSAPAEVPVIAELGVPLSGTPEPITPEKSPVGLCSQCKRNMRIYGKLIEGCKECGPW